MSSFKEDNATQSKWDRIYENSEFSVPTDVLLENCFLLPKKGIALDLASGLGANALYMAETGLDTHAWDISSVALNRLQLRGKQKGLDISSKQLSITADVLSKNTFDVIVVSRYLDRSLSTAIVDSLKSSGLLFYQTYAKDKLSSDGPSNPDYLLQRNELLQLFGSLKIVVYKEHSLIGDLQCGERNEAHFVGQKC